jgi:hypothetical protein
MWHPNPPPLQAIDAYNKSLMEHRNADTLKRLQETERVLKVRCNVAGAPADADADADSHAIAAAKQRGWWHIPGPCKFNARQDG